VSSVTVREVAGARGCSQEAVDEAALLWEADLRESGFGCRVSPPREQALLCFVYWCCSSIRIQHAQKRQEAVVSKLLLLVR